MLVRSLVVLEAGASLSVQKEPFVLSSAQCVNGNKQCASENAQVKTAVSGRTDYKYEILFSYFNQSSNKKNTPNVTSVFHTA